MKNSDSFEKYLTRFVEAAEETIGENLLGVYLHGSALWAALILSPVIWICWLEFEQGLMIRLNVTLWIG